MDRARPHTRNYVVLVVLAVAAAALTSVRRIPGVLAQVLGWRSSPSCCWRRSTRCTTGRALSGVLDLELGGNMAQLNLFPSGHLAITAALATSMALLFPRLRGVLLAYVGAIALTRVVFAHFLIDVLADDARRRERAPRRGRRGAASPGARAPRAKRSRTTRTRRWPP